MTDIDLEAELGLLAGRCITNIIDEPCIVPHWVLIVDARSENGESHVGSLTPSGMPEWMKDALLREASGMEFDPTFFDDDDDESSDEDE